MRSLDWTREKVAVVAGGPSCEREISLISGKAVFEALVAQRIPAILLDPTEDFIRALRKGNISMAFLALHGTFGEDGTVQRMLEQEGILYTGSGVVASETTFDKSKAQLLFQKVGVRVPEFTIVRRDGQPGLPKTLSFPVAVKPSTSGSSVGISIVADRRDLEKALGDFGRALTLYDNFDEGENTIFGLLDKLIHQDAPDEPYRNSSLTLTSTVNNHKVTKMLFA